MLYHRSALHGLSGISADTRELLDDPAHEAGHAIDAFAFRIARETAAIANTLGGLDGLVFTAGIGEHQLAIRDVVCRRLRGSGCRSTAGRRPLKRRGSKPGAAGWPSWRSRPMKRP